MTIESDFKITMFDRKKTGSGRQPQEHAKNTKAAAFFSAFFAFFVSTQFPTHFGSLPTQINSVQLT